MPMQAYFKATVLGQRPGDIIEIRSTETAKLVASGEADIDGMFVAQYPASVGPVSASARRVLGAAPWLDDLEVARGDLFTSDNFGGKLLECRIGGTTGLVEPTEADRLHERYSRMWNSRYLSGFLYKVGPGDSDVREKTYYSSTYDDDPKFDNWVANWPLERIVEMVCSQDGAFALLDDGSVRYTSRNSTSTSGNAYYGYEAVKTWPKVIKLTEWAYGCVALGVDGKLYAASERYASAYRFFIRDFIDANPTAVHFCGGADDEDMATLILADGTIVSQDATIQADTAFITDAAMGKVNGGANSTRNWIFVSQDHQRLYVKNRDEILTYTGHIHPNNPDDRVARIMCGYGIVFFQMESGRQGRWWGKAGVSTIKHGGQLGSYMAGKPQEVQLYLNQWGYNANLETDYLITPKGAVNLTVASGWSTGIRMALDPNNGERILMDGNPLVTSGDCVFALIDPPTEDLMRHQPVSVESIEIEGDGGSDGEISGTVTIEGEAAARDLVAISAAKQGSERTVVGHATSAAGDGAYTMELPGFIDPVMVLALDDSGEPWRAEAGQFFGDRVYPSASAHTGLVYEALGNGTTGTVEPTWPTEAGQNVVDGTITWTAAEHYRGQLHGPVIPGVVGEATTMDPIAWDGDVYLWAGLLKIEGVSFYRYRKSTDQAVKIYLPVETPADMTENLYLYEYEQTLVGALNYHVFTNSIDSDDHIYRTLSGDTLDTLLPLPILIADADFRDGRIAQHWTVTDAGWIDNQVQSSVPAPSGAPGYGYAGASDTLTSMYRRIPIDTLLPGDPAGYGLAFWWHQMSYAGDDTARLEIRFLNASDAVLGSATIGPDYAPDPGLVFELQSLTTGAIPAGATQVELTFVATRFAGSNNNAYIDSYGAELVVL